MFPQKINDIWLSSHIRDIDKPVIWKDVQNNNNNKSEIYFQNNNKSLENIKQNPTAKCRNLRNRLLKFHHLGNANSKMVTKTSKKICYKE